MPENWHNLLKRQYKRYFGAQPLPKDLEPFLEAVNKAYCDFDTDRNMIERSMEYSSQELLQANVEMRAVFQAFPDIFLRVDADGKILNYKAGSDEGPACFTENLTGQYIHNMPDEAVRNLFLENITKIKNNKLMISVDYGTAINGRDQHFEMRFIPLGQERSIVIIRNVTKQKIAENEMMRLVAAMESAGDMILITDIKGSIQHVNAAFEQVTGYKRQEVIGKSPNILKSGKQSEEFYKQLWGTITRGEIWQGVFFNKKKDGSFYEVETVITPVLDGRGRVINYVAASRDVTQRNQAEELQKKNEREIRTKNESLKKNEQALRNMLIDLKKTHDDLKSAQNKLLQSEKLASIGQLAAGVAHEINNPVGFISNNMEILQEYVASYEKILRAMQQVKAKVDSGDVQGAKEAVGELKKLEEEVNLDFIMSDVNKLLEHSGRGLDRVRKIVLDLRTFAREDNAETKDIIKIEEVIDSVLSIVQSELKVKAELIKDYGDTPIFHCSSQRLGQVFINLLINAAHAIEDKGKVTIKTYKQGQHVCVDITDTGKGIPQENLKKIFDPFFTTKPVGKGTGLGLSVSYEIIKKHGGEIEVHSEVGKGTTFTVKLPIA